MKLRLVLTDDAGAEWLAEEFELAFNGPKLKLDRVLPGPTPAMLPVDFSLIAKVEEHFEFGTKVTD